MSLRDENRRPSRGLRTATALSLLAGTSLLIGTATSSATASAAAPCGSTGVFSAAGATSACTYNGAGTEDTFAVPSGVTSLQVTVIGVRHWQQRVGTDADEAEGGAGGLAQQQRSRGVEQAIR